MCIHRTFYIAQQSVFFVCFFFHSRRWYLYIYLPNMCCLSQLCGVLHCFSFCSHVRMLRLIIVIIFAFYHLIFIIIMTFYRKRYLSMAVTKICAVSKFTTEFFISVQCTHRSRQMNWIIEIDTKNRNTTQIHSLSYISNKYSIIDAWDDEFSLRFFKTTRLIDNTTKKAIVVLFYDCVFHFFLLVSFVVYEMYLDVARKVRFNKDIFFFYRTP